MKPYSLTALTSKSNRDTVEPLYCGSEYVGEEHLQKWHVLNAWKCVLLGKELSH